MDSVVKLSSVDILHMLTMQTITCKWACPASHAVVGVMQFFLINEK
jgi:hypothetical protein